ncbi:MAG: HAD family hydrolase [Verrucomicrobiales bacterium]|nr:HAD family hydrolase [Verrucomicrobiales bacterium]
MLAIFDIDGTVCDTQDVEERCYATAFEEVCGVSLSTLDWNQYPEATSSGIFRSVLNDRPDLLKLEQEFESRFVQLLKEAQPEYPADFSPISGAVEFIDRLSDSSGISVAFATGGYYSEAEFKLKCCGIDLAKFPQATSSDVPGRSDIITLAAQRAGLSLSRSVYFGDALWDISACNRIQLPMIGIGRRIDQLREHGLTCAFRDYSNSDAIWNAFRRAANEERDSPANPA